MEKFIDIHCHLLPGVDDGARDLPDAQALLRMAWEDGTGTMVLTPHYRGRFRQNGPEQLEKAFVELGQHKPAGMALYLGSEVGYERDVAEKLTEGKVLSLGGGPYVLLEFSVATSQTQVLEGVTEMLSSGRIPIIAHVERYPVFLRDKRLTGAVLEMGALLQINADSVLGENGLGVKWFCHWLLKGRRAHFVASDSHDLVHRPPKLGACYRHVCAKYGAHYAAALFWENARVVLALK